MSNQFLLAETLDDIIIPCMASTSNCSNGKKSSNSKSQLPSPKSSTSSSSTTAVPTISSLLSSINALHQSAIRNECQQAMQPRSIKRTALLHSGAPPPPISTTHPPLSFRTGRPIQPSRKSSTSTSSSDQWYHMRSTPMTSELKMDLNILQNRNYLDTKRFYKSSSIDKKNPGVLQLGTVIEGSHEYYSNRYTNKERSQTFIQEVMKDNKINHYATQKYKTMQQQQTIKSQQQRQRRTKSPLLSTSAGKNASNKKPIFKKSQNQKR